MGPNAWLMSDLALALPAFQLAEVEGDREREEAAAKAGNVTYDRTED